MNLFYLLFSALVVVFTLDTATAAPIGVGPTNTATITHDPGFNSPGSPGVNGPFETTSAFPVFQYPETTFSGGPTGPSSTGKGGISNLIDPNIFGLLFPNTTGVSQTNTQVLGNVTPATLQINFTVDFRLDPAGFPFNVEEGFFPLIGNVGEHAGDFVSFTADATFTSAALGVHGPGVHLSYFNNTPGQFTKQLLFISDILEPLPANDTVTLQGSVLFTASDPSSDIHIGSLGDGGGPGPFPPPIDGLPPGGHIVLRAVPEPASWLFLMTGLGGLAVWKRIKRLA